jgi:hypothetical protein
LVGSKLAAAVDPFWRGLRVDPGVVQADVVKKGCGGSRTFFIRGGWQAASLILVQSCGGFVGITILHHLRRIAIFDDSEN